MILKSKYTMDESSDRPERPFVGREQELAIFKAAVDAKFGGRDAEREKTESKVIVFHGVAGIGKSALSEQLAMSLQKEPVTFPLIMVQS